MKFKVGDRVKVTRYYEEVEGKIVDIRSNSISVEHVKSINGHTCRGRCKCGYGWYYNFNEVSLLNDSTNLLILLL